jgi:hypothetical protein
MTNLTRHAAVRLQQRAIPAVMVKLFEEYASETRSGGADCLFFDRAARKRLQAAMGGARGLRIYEPWLNVYFVINDEGDVVTAGHRSKRRKQH